MKGNKGLIVLVVLLMMSLLGTSGFIVYDNFFKEEFVGEINITAVNKEELEALGKSFFNQTMYASVFENIFYKEKIENYENLRQDAKMALAYSIVPNSDITYDFDCGYGNLNAGDTWCSKVSKEIFEVSYKKYFGNEISISDYNVGFNTSYPWLYCSLEGEDILCYPQFGGDVTPIQTAIQYNHTELRDSNIIVYVDYLITNTEEEVVYNDPDMSNEVGTYEGYLDNDELLSRFKEDVGTYKVTFKKDTVGNYYWYSNEFQK